MATDKMTAYDLGRAVFIQMMDYRTEAEARMRSDLGAFARKLPDTFDIELVALLYVANDLAASMGPETEKREAIRQGLDDSFTEGPLRPFIGTRSAEYARVLRETADLPFAQRVLHVGDAFATCLGLDGDRAMALVAGTTFLNWVAAMRHTIDEQIEDVD